MLIPFVASTRLRILNVRVQVQSKYLNVYRINAQSGRAVKTAGKGAGRVEVIFVVTGQNKFRTFLKSWQHHAGLQHQTPVPATAAAAHLGLIFPTVFITRSADLALGLFHRAGAPSRYVTNKVASKRNQPGLNYSSCYS